MAMLAAPSVLAESIRNRLSLSRKTFPLEPDAEDAERMIQRTVRDRKTTEGLVQLDMAGIAENGDSVPLVFDINCTMTGDDYPAVVHVFVKHNPVPEVARYYYGPWNGSAKTEMRVRMRRSSDLVVVAEMADGRVGIVRQPVDVLAGACG